MADNHTQHNSNGRSDLNPKPITIRFLQQFARCYSPQPSLTISALSGTVLN